MAFSPSTLATVIIGAVALSGSAFAVSLANQPADPLNQSSVNQPLDQAKPSPEAVPVSPDAPAITPVTPVPLPTQSPVITDPPSFQGDDEDSDDDSEDEDWEDDGDRDHHDDYDDDDYEDEWDD